MYYELIDRGIKRCLCFQIYIHRTLDSVYEHVPQRLLPVEYLPEEYDGEHAGSIEQLIGMSVSRDQHHWKQKVVMVLTLSRLVAPQVVLPTICGATIFPRISWVILVKFPRTVKNWYLQSLERLLFHYSNITRGP